MSAMWLDSAILRADNGLSVLVYIEPTDIAPRLVIEPMGECAVEGDMPGSYYLVTEGGAR